MAKLGSFFSEGYGIIPKNVMRDQSISVYSKAVIAYMLSYTGAGKNQCWPSIDTISDDLQVSRESTIKAIKTLCDHKYLIKEKMKTDNPMLQKNIYTIVFMVDDGDSSPGVPCMATGSTLLGHQVAGNSITLNSITKENSNKRTHFIPPTVDEVKAYLAELSCTSIQADHFVDYYETRDWMLKGYKMKNWKAAVRYWKNNPLRDSHKAKKNTGEHAPGGRGFGT